MKKKTLNKKLRQEVVQTSEHIDMQPGKKLIRKIMRYPFNELWDESGVIDAHLDAYIDAERITEILKDQSVRFMMANVGGLPRWIEKTECYKIWKEQLKGHLCTDYPDIRRPYDVPGGYCLEASEWHTEAGEIIIVFFSNH
jgi:hypothetical protein